MCQTEAPTSSLRFIQINEKPCCILPGSQIGQLNCCYGAKEAYMTIYYDFQLMMEDILINGVSQNHSFIRQKSLKLHCHEDFAVLGQFYAKIITLRL